jgi:rifampicin phosphotransferase
MATDEQYVIDLAEVDETRAALVGGKGANLGALSRTEGITVPPGFCVTTRAFDRFLVEAADRALVEQLEELSGALDPGRAAALGARVRRAIEGTDVPDDLAAAITRAYARLGAATACAVRSSATAEDLPTASFAGQQDTFLDVVGPVAVLEHVRRCWASLFTDRAVTYRRQHGFDHRRVRMGVVVQEMVAATAAGVLFTADPVTGHRRICSVEAGPGLGEALVSGRVNPDVFTVHDGVVTTTVGRAATVAGPGPSLARTRPVLTDAQVLRLVGLGRRIEARFGRPQDIEWCLAGDDFRIVQSRPITTLFPPPGSDDGENHVYVSVGHQQMMTDAMTPLGLSFWQMTTPVPMAEAGSRLFVDVTRRLASPTARPGLLDALGRSDPLTGDALRALAERPGFLPERPGDEPPAPLPGLPPEPLEPDPAIVADLVEQSRASIAAAAREIETRSGVELFDVIEADLAELRRILFDPRSHQVFMSAMEASWWLDDHLRDWLGEERAADVLSRSVPGNVTSEMGLALLDVADVIRAHPEVVAYLRQVGTDDFRAGLGGLPGGPAVREAVDAWLARYGMRAAGEIDITRPRWSERPSMLLPALLGNVKNFEPGASAAIFERGRREARAKADDVLERLRARPDGEREAARTQEMIERVRTFIGYREYPKYGMVSRYFVYKRALLAEAARLVEAGVLAAADDIFYLRFDEVREVARTNRVDRELVRRRREAFAADRALTPPRVITSDGEVVTGVYRREGLPPGALAGLPVSAGIVEGRARVVLDPARADVADLDEGDILVTAYTDPSWTPLFVAIAGLVTEVGGLMTHGAVIAREYGLPAVVGVVDATRRIADGQRIRVDAVAGHVEILT